MKQKLKGGDEWDCIYSRKYHNPPSGGWKAIKQKMNKRFRKDGKRIDKLCSTED